MLMKILLLIVYGVLVGYLSLQPLTISGAENADKIAHFGAYGLFALLALFASKNDRMFLLLCLVIALYGGLLEIAQGQLPYRHLSVYDFIANSVGVATVFWLKPVIERFVPATTQR